MEGGGGPRERACENSGKIKKQLYHGTRIISKGEQRKRAAGGVVPPYTRVLTMGTNGGRGDGGGGDV